MSKLFLLSLIVFSINVHSQNTFPSNGNVGIGTTSPSEDLEVDGTALIKQAEIINTLPDGTNFSNASDMFAQTKLLSAGVDDTGGGLMTFYDMPQSNFLSLPAVRLTIEDRADAARFRLWADEGSTSSLRVFDSNQSPSFDVFAYNSTTQVSLNKPNSCLSIGGVGVSPSIQKFVVRDGNALVEGNVLAEGNVGIGTESFTDGSDTFRLSVSGNIRAEGVKVYTDWADFVFEEDYNLPSLYEVEEYIKSNGHLKNIPSSKEVEINGIELGEMNKLLLQKIEELTLYTIQLKKEIDSLKDKND